MVKQKSMAYEWVEDTIDEQLRVEVWSHAVNGVWYVIDIMKTENVVTEWGRLCTVDEFT